MNSKEAKKLRKYASKEWRQCVAQLYKARPKFIPKFIWIWIMKRAFVKK